MALNCLKVNQFRNIASASINFCPNFNIFYGANGSGKTSVLEALYHLSTNRSFRRHLNERIIRHGEASFVLYAEFLNDYTLGIQKFLQAPTQIRLCGEKLSTTATIARLLPMVLLNYDSFSWITEGSAHRRRAYDWLLFHVEHGFIEHWQQYQKILKQRHVALKQGVSLSQLAAWDHALVHHGEMITALRERHFSIFAAQISKNLAWLLPDMPDLRVSFNRGYSRDKAFSAVLAECEARDRERGFTQYGPHRADLLFSQGEYRVRDIFSRGQQKALLLGITLAQIQCYQQLCDHQQTPIVLIDDIASEVDGETLARIFALLDQLNAQVFITVIDKNQLRATFDSDKARMFHVEQGLITALDADD